MATIDIHKAHNTTPDEAAEKMRSLLEKFAQKRAELVSDVSWGSDGRKATVTGKGFKGSFEVNDSAVTVAIDLSFIARPFKGRIKQELDERLAASFDS